MNFKFDEEASGRTIELAAGQDFEIGLKENPTTGFRWNIVQNGSPVCSIIQQNFTPGLGATGQAGIQIWKFKVAAVGQTTIELTSRRAWESSSAAGSTFILHLTGTK